MNQVVRREIVWWTCGLAFLLAGCSLAGCSQELQVDEYKFTCDPAATGQCGSGYECRSVPGEDFSACYKFGTAPGEDASTGDVADDAPSTDTGVDVAPDAPTADVRPDADTSTCGPEICGDFVDNDCDGVPENGCETCEYGGSPKGACGRAVKSADGVCLPPPDYREVEEGCGFDGEGRLLADGLDNDCDGLKDEAVADMVTTGNDHACILVQDQVYCWGKYGSDTSAVATRAERIQLLPNNPITMISAGGEHTCARAGNGEVFCWGDGSKGQLGDGTTQSSERPRKVVDEQSTPIKFSHIASGSAHTCGITQPAPQKPPRVLCWGDNDKYQLGVSNPSMGDAFRSVPVEVDHDWQGRPIRLGLGDKHSCVVTEPDDRTKVNQLWCWGANGGGQLGKPSNTVGDSADPLEVQLTNGAGVARVDGGFGHTCAVSTEGFADCWGLNVSGQLGTGDTSDRHSPTAVQNSLQFRWVRAGENHTCGLEKDSSRPYCWGSNETGAVGTGTVPPHRYLYPTQIGALTEATSIDAGRFFSCAISKHKNVLCWGANEHAQLGSGDMVDASSPRAALCARPAN